MATTTRKTTTARKAPARKAPASARKPADRKPPAPKVTKTETGSQITVQGITLTIEDEALDDFELLDLMGRAESEQNPALLPELLRRFVGEDGYRKAMDHLRGPNGRVGIEDAVQLVNEMMGALNPNS